jgi:hypothetical protein
MESIETHCQLSIMIVEFSLWDSQGHQRDAILMLMVMAITTKIYSMSSEQTQCGL